MICKECGRECADFRVLGTHIAKIHKITTEEYYRKHLLTDNSDKCKECNGMCKFINLKLGFHTFCSVSCQSKNSNRNRVCFFATDEGKQKIRESLLRKYNVEHSSQIPGISEKRSNSHEQNTGYDLWHDPNIIAKRKETRATKDYSEIYKKINENKLLKYGNKCNYEQVKNTILNHYGVENPFQSKEIMDECWRRYEQKTGYDHPSHNPNVIRKIRQKYEYDNQYFDSSWEIAYYIWLKDNAIDFEFHPNDSFEYITSDGKVHKYFPDFKVGDEYIEIKGDHLYEKHSMSMPPEKIECMQTNGIKILRSAEIKPILNYICNRYGKNFIKQYRKILNEK